MRKWNIRLNDVKRVKVVKLRDKYEEGGKANAEDIVTWQSDRGPFILSAGYLIAPMFTLWNWSGANASPEMGKTKR